MRLNSFHLNLIPETFLQNLTLIFKKVRYCGLHIFSLYFDLSKVHAILSLKIKIFQNDRSALISSLNKAQKGEWRKIALVLLLTQNKIQFYIIINIFNLSQWLTSDRIFNIKQVFYLYLPHLINLLMPWDP